MPALLSERSAPGLTTNRAPSACRNACVSAGRFCGSVSPAFTNAVEFSTAVVPTGVTSAGL